MSAEQESSSFYLNIKLAHYNIVDMDGVSTPVKGGTDTATQLISVSELRTPAREDSHVEPHGHNHSTSSRPEMPSAHSTDSITTNSSSTFSTPFDKNSSPVVTPLTPPPSEDAKPKRQNPMQCEANPKGKDSEQSILNILQSVKSQGNSDAVQRPSTPQPETDVLKFGSGSFVYYSDFKFSCVAPVGLDSPTPKNVRREVPNTTAEQHSARPAVPEVESNDSNSCSETQDVRLRDLRASKKARRGGSSLSPTRSLSEDAHQQLVNSPSVIPIAIPTARPPSRDSSPNRSTTPYPKASLETTASLITSPQVEVSASVSDDVVAASHNSPNGTSSKPKGRSKKSNGTPTKPKGPTPQGESRRSPRFQRNIDKTNAGATTGPNVEESYFSPNSDEVGASQNLRKGMRGKSGAGTLKLDEDEAIIDENQASATSGCGPPIKVSEKPDVDTAKKAGNIEFEQYKEMKSPADIKIAILNVILQENKKHSLDKEKGFVYIYKLGSSEGHVKIGKSKQKHGVRVEQWAKNCKLPFERISDPNDKRFLHYGIVEKLVHTELANMRKVYECGTCKRKGSNPPDAKVDHTEWFKVTEPVALEVIERWRGWLVRQQPYGKDGALRGIWIWKHGKLSEGNTDDLKQWVILTWPDWSAYTWYRIDNYLDEELPTILRSSLFINATLIFVTRLCYVF
ncbi:hypothetical protein V500_11331 [Pseudogymnoascus sp. VKM F-4518 (FW-2643)]|nr:hypothetical protein V500_11331 [Pseudogymnoascus sp. VKM F-4518 (FW-2643)]